MEQQELLLLLRVLVAVGLQEGQVVVAMAVVAVCWQHSSSSSQQPWARTGLLVLIHW